MKSTLFIGVVLATSQCVSEPSGTVGTEAATTGSATHGTSVDAGSRVDSSTADMTDATTGAEAARRLLEPGPAPFTVPTARISWPQQQATLIAPQGARIDGDGLRARVTLGEGYNFAYRIAPAGAVELPAPGESATVPAREDGAVVWYRDNHWFFSGTFGTFDCWNDAQSRHDRAEVEMMLASCRSIEQDTSPQ